MTHPHVLFKALPHGADLPIPGYQTPDSAGMDLYAAVTAPITLEAGARALIPTGFAMAIPAGYEAQVRPRSGLALKKGLTVLNTPGTIDSDYRGEIGVILINQGRESVVIERGDRIAQMIFAPVVHVQWRVVETLADTERGENGFGSTGGAEGL